MDSVGKGGFGRVKAFGSRRALIAATAHDCTCCRWRMEGSQSVSAFPIFSATAAAVASAIQAAVALSQMRDDEQGVIRHWEARDGLRSEISRPVRRWRRGADIRELIDQAETPEFWRRF